jgi:glycosyltransferase involved in cell wall biosynthesis
VLLLPSFYETPQVPYSGTFFRDWAMALQQAGVTTGVAYVETRGLRTLSVAALRQSHFQLTCGSEGGLPTVRLRGWNTLAQSTLGGVVWSRLAQIVIGEYIERYGRPDLVAAQSATWAGVAAARAAARWRLPYVITEVDTGFGTGAVRHWHAALSRRAFTHARAVIAISRNLRERLLRLGGPKHVELIPCTVDESYWTLPPRPRPTGPFTFYAQAHLTPRKGFDLLIRAFAARFREDPSVRLVLGGDGVIRNDLEALARSLGVRSSVSFLGQLPRDGVREAMWNANCFVLPSRAENFGVVLIEALATGLPVISTRCGGPEDIISDAVGIIRDPGDEAGLGEALLTMRERPQPDAQPIREYAVARYGYSTIGPSLRDFYCSVLDRR